MGITLVVLAAGIGSRYGGLKQVEAVGPRGAIVIEYSVFDAIRNGFDRVVCVIRRDIEKDFKSIVSARFSSRVAVDYVYQEMTDIPAGFALHPDRRKPWGTAHAVYACRDAVHEPFAVINADDFYGRESFAALARHLRSCPPQGVQYGMVGFELRNTLSAHGTVSRGVCSVDADGFLRGVVERTKIEPTESGARYREQDGAWITLSGAEMVSLNMWGLSPSIFGTLAREFELFLRHSGCDPKAEFFLPAVVDGMVAAGTATVKVLPASGQWFGVTYPEDKAAIVAGIRRLIDTGFYPEKLWEE
jgi:hypothetical protein